MDVNNPYGLLETKQIAELGLYVKCIYNVDNVSLIMSVLKMIEVGFVVFYEQEIAKYCRKNPLV